MTKLLCILVPTLVLAHTCICQAQDVIDVKGDPYENGANRRISSPTGYGGVWVYFTEPDISNIQFQQSKVSVANPQPGCDGKIPPQVQTKTFKKDVPQMYVGISGRDNGQVNLEADAGVTLKYPDISRNDNRVTKRHPDTAQKLESYSSTKWTVFCRVQGVAADKSAYSNPNCPGPYQTISNYKNRKLLLSVKGLGKVGIALFVQKNQIRFAWHQVGKQRYYHESPWANGITPQEVYDSATVKRVIAMTQQGSPDLDGSSMTNAIASECQLNQFKAFANGIVTVGKSVYDNTSPIVFQPWSTVTASDGTHFFPSYRWHKEKKQSETWIPFVIQGSRDLKTGALINDPACFDYESITINMNPAAPSRGDQAHK